MIGITGYSPEVGLWGDWEADLESDAWTLVRKLSSPEGGRQRDLVRQEPTPRTASHPRRHRTSATLVLASLRAVRHRQCGGCAFPAPSMANEGPVDGTLA